MIPIWLYCHWGHVYKPACDWSHCWCRDDEWPGYWSCHSAQHQLHNKHRENYRVSQKDIVFRNVADFLLRGIWAVKIWVFWGAEHIYAINRCLAHVPNLATLVWTPISTLCTSEWPFNQRFCHFSKDDLFLGHPVYSASEEWAWAWAMSS